MESFGIDHHSAAGLVILLVVIGLLALLAPWWVTVIVGVVVAVPVLLVARQVRRALRRRVAVGAETLPGSTAVVAAEHAQGEAGTYLVRLSGELWTAESQESLKVGDRALVLGVEHGRLIICRLPLELDRPRVS